MIEPNKRRYLYSPIRRKTTNINAENKVSSNQQPFLIVSQKNKSIDWWAVFVLFFSENLLLLAQFHFSRFKGVGEAYPLSPNYAFIWIRVVETIEVAGVTPVIPQSSTGRIGTVERSPIIVSVPSREGFSIVVCHRVSGSAWVAIYGKDVAFVLRTNHEFAVLRVGLGVIEGTEIDPQDILFSRQKPTYFLVSEPEFTSERTKAVFVVLPPPEKVSSAVLSSLEYDPSATIGLLIAIYLQTSKWKFEMRHSKSEPRHDKTNKMSVRPAKTQINLGIRPVWSESSLSAWRNLGSLATYWAQSEDSDQTGRMPRLIWVFAGGTHILLFLSWLKLTCAPSRN